MINNIKTDIFYDGYYWQGSQIIIQLTKKCNINNIHQIIRYFYEYINLLLTASKVYINNDIQQRKKKKQSISPKYYYNFYSLTKKYPMIFSQCLICVVVMFECFFFFALLCVCNICIMIVCLIIQIFCFFCLYVLFG